jgi:hypothetical protein
MTDDKQKTFDYIKHGFTQDDVVVRVKPLEKKSVIQMIQLYDKVGEDQRFVEVNETYRWGFGYLDGDSLEWEGNFQGAEFHCSPEVGHGADLDDLVAVDFDYGGPWTEEQKEEFEDRWYNGDPADDDGRSGMGWVHDWQTEWQIEDDSIIVMGPVQFDVVSKTEYNKVFIEDYKPNKETDNG